MITEELISKSIDDAIVKCGRVSKRTSVSNAFSRVSEKYGLKLKKEEVVERKDFETDERYYDSVYTLYDDEYNTKLVFTEKFLDDNPIAFNPQGNHKNHNILLDELVEGYLRLPDNNKNSVNQITFKYLGDGLISHKIIDGELTIVKDKDFIAFSTFQDRSAKELNTITIPSWYFKNRNLLTDECGNYDYLLAHESSHCLDFRWVSEEEYNIRKAYMSRDSSDDVINKYYELSQREFDKSNGEYDRYSSQNAGFLKLNMDNLKSSIQRYNKASDYGATVDYEDFAEVGAMVVLGWKNPDNPKAVIKWNGEPIQYREWIKYHPYKAQYLIKEVYREDVGIDRIMEDRIDTPRNSFKNK